MPALPYLAPGDRIDSDVMNAIWAELERKMALLLCGKSPLVVDGLDLDLLENRNHQAALGKLAAFFRATTPNNRVTTRGMAAYDHSVYDAAVSDASIVGQDDTRHIAWMTGLTANLDESLAAHTVDVAGKKYMVGPGTYPTAYERPQRRYRYAVAEIIVENRDDLLIPDTWDKYNFWRIHNVDRSLTLSVRFGAHHAMTIAPMECITVRRDTVTTGYVTGRYFWRWQDGDGTFYSAGANATRFPERSMLANNITNPAILFHWVRILTSANVRERFGWELDLSDVVEMAEHYVDRYADPAKDGSSLGDLLWHKGTAKLAVMAGDGTTTFKDAEWKGCNKPPAGPLQRTRNGDGSVTIGTTETDPCDLVGLTTNIAATTADPGRAVAALPITLPAAPIYLAYLAPQGTEQATVTVSHVPLGQSVYRYEDYHYDTYADPVTRFRPFGPTSLVGDMKTWIASIWGEIGTGWLSPNGFRWEMHRDVPFRLPGFQLPASYSVGASTVIERDHITIGLGWPGNEYPLTQFLPCRVDRISAAMVQTAKGWLHPEFASVDLTTDGADWPVPQPVLAGPDSGISLQQLVAPDQVETETPPTELDAALIQYWNNPVPTNNVAAILGKVSDPDWYQDNRTAALGAYSAALETAALGAPRIIRAPMTAEHVNHMAWLVNGIDRCRPLTVEDVAWGVNGAEFRFGSNAIGLVDQAGTVTTIRPRGQYAAVHGDATAEAAYRALGMTVLTEADLPVDWHAANLAWRTADTHNTWRINLKKQYGDGVVKSSGGFGAWLGWYEVPYTWSYEGIELLGTNRSEFEVVPTSPFVFVDQTFRWVDVEAVQAFAEARGLAFIHAEAVRPIRIVMAESAAPSLLPWSVTTATGLERGGDNAEVTQLLVETVAQYWLDQIKNTAQTAHIDFEEARLSLRLAESEALEDSDLVASPGWLNVSGLEQSGEANYICREPAERRQRSVYRWVRPATENGSFQLLAFVEGVPADVRSIDAAEIRLLEFDPIVSGADDASVALLTSVHTVTRQADFATLGNAQYEHNQRFGAVGRPPTYHAPAPASSRMDQIETGLVGCQGGERAFVATIIPEITLDLQSA